MWAGSDGGRDGGTRRQAAGARGSAQLRLRLTWRRPEALVASVLSTPACSRASASYLRAGGRTRQAGGQGVGEEDACR